MIYDHENLARHAIYSARMRKGSWSMHSVMPGGKVTRLRLFLVHRSGSSSHTVESIYLHGGKNA